MAADLELPSVGEQYLGFITKLQQAPNIIGIGRRLNQVVPGLVNQAISEAERAGIDLSNPVTITEMLVVHMYQRKTEQLQRLVAGERGLEFNTPEFVVAAVINAMGQNLLPGNDIGNCVGGYLEDIREAYRLQSLQEQQVDEDPSAEQLALARQFSYQQTLAHAEHWRQEVFANPRGFYEIISGQTDDAS